MRSNARRSAVLVVAVSLFQGSAQAGSISATGDLTFDPGTPFVSNGGILAAAVPLDPNNEVTFAKLTQPYQVSYPGLSFSNALTGAYGSYTPTPAGAPPGTQVINIPTPYLDVNNDWNGQNGYFFLNFTLPADYGHAVLVGSANVDDASRAFLNQNALGPPNSISEYGNATFWSADPGHFHPGVNELQFPDANSGYGPSGASFYGYVAYGSGSFDPGETDILPISGVRVLNGNGTLTLGAGSSVQGNSSSLLVNNATIEGGGNVEVAVSNFGNFIVASDLTSYAAGNAFVQMGNFTIPSGVALRGFDTGGHDYAFVQGYGTALVNGLLDFSPAEVGAGTGQIVVSGGELQIGAGGTVHATAGGGANGVGFQQQQGNTYVADGGTIAISMGVGSGGVGIRLEDGGLWVQSGGTIALGIGGGSGGVGIEINGGQLAIQSGGYVGPAPAAPASGSSSIEPGAGLTIVQTNGTVSLDGVIDVRGAEPTGFGYELQQGRLHGSGVLLGGLLADGGTIAPGNSPGTLSVDSLLWTKGTFVFDINSAEGGAGAAGGAGGSTGWSLLSVSTTAELNVDPLNPIVLQLHSLTALDAAGPVFDFDPGQSYHWAFLAAGAGISGFDPSSFSIDLTDFFNPTDGQFSVSQVGNTLVLDYVAVPEIPNPLLILTGMSASLGTRVIKRRRAMGRIRRVGTAHHIR